METIKLQRRADDNGILTIHVPPALRDRDLEVLVVLQPLAPPETVPAGPANERGWPIGFFEETYGSLAADLLERLPQGELDEREALR